MPAIPIVSLIDILVILLIFFIATTTFRRNKTHVKIALPESKGMGAAAPVQEVRTSITITKDKDILLDGELVAEGGESRLFVMGVEAMPDIRRYCGRFEREGAGGR